MGMLLFLSNLAKDYVRMKYPGSCSCHFVLQIVGFNLSLKVQVECKDTYIVQFLPRDSAVEYRMFSKPPCYLYA